MLCASAGNCARTHARSSAANEDEGNNGDERNNDDEEDAGSAVGIADILMPIRHCALS